MNKIIIPVLAIALVAVLMGMSVVAPMIPTAFAHDVPPQAFLKAHEICFRGISLPPDVAEAICGHDFCPPNCGGGFSVESKTF